MIKLVKESIVYWANHRATRLGAAISYYTVFSLAPLLIILIALAGLVLDKAVVTESVVEEVTVLVGKEGGEFIESIMKTTSEPSTGIIATIIGIATLLLGATAVFAELKASMDDFWNTPKKIHHKGFLAFIKKRVLSFSMIPVLVFLLLISLVLSAGINSLSDYIKDIANVKILFNTIDIAISFVLVTMLFAFIYRFIPDIKLPWKETLLGASATSILFAIGKFLISFYLTKALSIDAYGSAGALIIIMVWVYYSVQIFFIGASITYVYSKKHGYLKNR